MRSTIKSLFASQKIRFAAVGIINTATDFVALFSLVTFFGLPVYIANILSTSLALSVSYILNKRTVFKDQNKSGVRQILLFVAVTLAGLWIVQGAVIWLFSTILAASTSLSSALILLIAKLIASVFSLVWNYIWYNKVIFKSKTSEI